jgi:hypothetical protein
MVESVVGFAPAAEPDKKYNKNQAKFIGELSLPFSSAVVLRDSDIKMTLRGPFDAVTRGFPFTMPLEYRQWKHSLKRNAFVRPCTCSQSSSLTYPLVQNAIE